MRGKQKQCRKEILCAWRWHGTAHPETCSEGTKEEGTGLGKWDPNVGVMGHRMGVMTWAEQIQDNIYQVALFGTIP